MPSAKRRGGGRRTAIYDWRVKCGKKEVFAHPQKMQCEVWMREHADEFEDKLRLIPPSY